MVLPLFNKLPIAAQAALISTAFISFIPNILFLALPSYKTGEGMTSQILSIGQAMAAGSLLGDVFLHTFEDAQNNPSAGISILCGYVLFLIADILLRTLNPSSNKSSHSHSDSNNRTHESTSTSSTKPVVHQSTIYLNLAADSLHNFTDGLAIGASYATVVVAAASTTTESSCCSSNDALWKMILSRNGLVATIAILLHEIPHELGDFCTLVKAGYSKADAVKAQFGTAIAAFAGTITALYLVSNNTAIQEQLVFITAGGFIYLAATTLLPEVSSN